MKYYLIAGEASGDLHGSRLIKAIRKQDPQASFRAWGGDLMETSGATLAKHYQSLAIMGLVDVIKNLNQIFKNISFCKKDIQEFQPDALGKKSGVLHPLLYCTSGVGLKSQSGSENKSLYRPSIRYPTL